MDKTFKACLVTIAAMMWPWFSIWLIHHVPIEYEGIANFQGIMGMFGCVFTVIWVWLGVTEGASDERASSV